VIRIPWTVDIKLPARDRLSASWSFSKRWLRVAVIAAAWILFILSSLEWCGPGPGADADPPATAAETKIARSVAGFATVAEPEPSPANLTTEEPASRATPRRGTPKRRWLLLGTIRI